MQVSFANSKQAAEHHALVVGLLTESTEIIDELMTKLEYYKNRSYFDA